MSLSRRQFLHTSTAATSAVSLTALAAGTARAVSSNEKVTVGVMGVNGRGAALANGFASLPDSEVAYICDVDERALEKCVAAVADLGKKPNGVKDFRKILDDPSVDALVIAAPDHWHAPATILACSAGKHVYVEKPCSHNPREGELAVAAARRHDRVVQMGNQRRSWPKIIEAIEQVQSGAIGNVYYSRGWYANLRGATGKATPAAVPAWLDFDLWQGPAPRREFHENLLHYNWHWFWHYGTGELGNNGVHALDVCRWGLGVDYPTRVTSAGGRYAWQDDQETPDTHLAAFDFEGGKSILWEGLSCNRRGIDGDSFGVTFHGETGTVRIVDEIAGYLVFDKGGKQIKEVKGEASDATHLQNFLDCIASGKRPASDIEEGHKSTLLCHLGNIAYRTGRTVNLAATADGLTHQIKGDEEQQALWGREYEKGWEPKV